MRDPDVLIYAVLLPVVLYPLCAVFVNEASLWYASMQEKNKPVIYVIGKSPLAEGVAAGLRRRKHFTVVDDNGDASMLQASDDLENSGANDAGQKSPERENEKSADIEKHAADKAGVEKATPAKAEAPLTGAKLEELKRDAAAFVTVDSQNSSIDIKAHETATHFGTIAEQIETDIRMSRFRALRRELRTRHIPVEASNIFDVQRKGLKKVRTTGATDNNIKQTFDKLIMLLVVFMILMMTVIGGPASVCMMAEEHEKKTYHTTLLLPINRMVIVFSKFLTVTAICVTGAAFNMFCLTLFALSLVFSTLGHSTNLTKLYYDLTHLTLQNGLIYVAHGTVAAQRIKPYIQLPTASEVLLMLVFFFTTGALLAAIYLGVAGYAKTVKSAQMLVSLPMIFLMTLPTLALIPGIQFNVQTALVPIANLLIMRKFDNPPLLPSLIALLEPLILIALILNVVRIIFESHAKGKRDKSVKTAGAVS